MVSCSQMLWISISLIRNSLCKTECKTLSIFYYWILHKDREIEKDIPFSSTRVVLWSHKNRLTHPNGNNKQKHIYFGHGKWLFYIEQETLKLSKLWIIGSCSAPIIDTHTQKYESSIQIVYHWQNDSLNFDFAWRVRKCLAWNMKKELGHRFLNL